MSGSFQEKKKNKSAEVDLFFKKKKLAFSFGNAAEYSHQENPGKGFLLLFSLKLNAGPEERLI